MKVEPKTTIDVDYARSVMANCVNKDTLQTNLSDYRIVIDIETLSLKRNAAILQIGAAVCNIFEPVFGIADSFEANINVTWQVLNGFDVDPETLHWHHKKQSQEKRDAMTHDGGELTWALTELENFIKKAKALDPTKHVRIYFRGYDFDYYALGHAMSKVGMKVDEMLRPWWASFNSIGCVREFISSKMNIPTGYIPEVLDMFPGKHTAKADAMNDLYQMWLANGISMINVLYQYDPVEFKRKEVDTLDLSEQTKSVE